MSLTDRTRRLCPIAARAALLGVAIAAATWPVHAAPAGAQRSTTPAAATAPATTDSPLQTEAVQLKLPDVEIRDQNGKKRRFVTDLVKGRSVAVNFIFTSCTSICSPLTANFKAMQAELERARAQNVHLISVSVDPLGDTPDELRKFARQFDADGPGWTFVTGSRASIDAILKAFGVTPGDPNDHTPIAFLGHAPSERWTRASGLGDPRQLAASLLALSRPAAIANGKVSEPNAAMIEQMRGVASQQAKGASAQKAASDSQGAGYFTNLPVLTHDRGPARFYNDLIRDRIVLVSTFYTSCKDVCSPLTFNLANTQKLLAQQLPGRVNLVSISTDPIADTEGVLREYAQRHGAGPGWSFVTGKKENIDWILYKLGLYEQNKTEHQIALWIGNDRTGAWLKLHAMASPEAIVDAVRKIL